MNIKTLMKKKSWKSCASAKVIKEEVSAHPNIDLTESPEEQLQSKEDVLKKIRKNPRIMSRFKHCTKCVVAEYVNELFQIEVDNYHKLLVRVL